MSFGKFIDFSTLTSLPSDLYWINGPPTYEIIQSTTAARRQTAGLHVSPAGKTDFWQKTFYSPPIIKSDGPALLMRVPPDLADEWTVETSFSLCGSLKQFDQAGIMVYVDEEKWLKAGIETVDGGARMSCVVTNGYSDWSTRPWHAPCAKIRVSHLRGSLVVECKKVAERNGEEEEKDEGGWNFYRIAPSVAPRGRGEGGEGGGGVSVGLMTCSPTEAGLTTLFHYLSTSHEVAFNHHS